MIHLTEEKIGEYFTRGKADAYAAVARHASRWIEVWVEEAGDNKYYVKGRVNPLKERGNQAA